MVKQLEYVIEVSFSLGLFVNAMLFIPQAIKLIKMKDSQDISMITFFGFLLIQLSAVLHGVMNKDNLLVFGTLLSMLTCGWVVILILYYRAKNKHRL